MTTTHLVLKSRRRSVAILTAALIGASTLTAATAGTAFADDPPGSTTGAAPPVEVDGSSPGLKMVDGATLAPAKVLDIKSVVEDLGGEERREDTNIDITFALQAEVLFGKDSAELNAKANARIKAIADEINKQGAKKIRVFGFTDNLGSYEHGKALSKQRADAVQQQLATTLDPGMTFEIRGYSEDYPIASNSTEEGRKKNRRVEISFPRGAGN
ncbi:OmpA family protein [Streptomyces sp. V1I1]|uniref:OmpA family protein n=1 Tax=Streptomyces sp. V1I1 TaxID=3042272 RepID=UPI00277EA313|nr:OmpA family protein [Streptomyces sp. V1I1]MDQ0941069.1 outer membrane protein OmpA-like peptidoglycan-associated protein [Streptomyces sp. V1I1]